MSDLTRPIIGIENRTAQEVFDIMCDRLASARPDAGDGYATPFFEIASMLGIGAQAKSPKEVWETQMRPMLEALIGRPDAGDEVERVAFSGADRMDRPTMDDVWRKGGWGRDVVANRTTVMRFIGSIDALEAEIAALAIPQVQS